MEKNIKVTKTEKTILDSCKAAKASGIKIQDGGWYIKWDSNQSKWTSEGSCCPLAAVILANQPTPSPEQIGEMENDEHQALCDIAAAILKKDHDWASDFTSNFDDEGEMGSNKSAIKAAAKLRSVFIKPEVDVDEEENYDGDM